MIESQPLLILDLEFGAQSTRDDDDNNSVRKTIGFMSN